ncbi:MAG: NAD(P)-dependent oxidoreductase, partial [Pseudomonadota bacterium]
MFLDFATMGPGLTLAPLEAVTPDLTVYDSTPHDQVAARIADAEIVFTNKIRLTPELFAAAPKLKFIGLTATGTDNIDLDAAASHGVGVANLRNYCTDSVAEHVFGTLLMLMRNLASYDRDVKAGDWQRSTEPLMMSHSIESLTGRTLGILGYGALGQGVASVAPAFGMRVLVSARPSQDEVPDGRVSFTTLLAEADVISLHCPLNDETRELFGADEFAAMKTSAILVNTARGGLVDTTALT